jgi:hypothetical protein
VGLLRRKDAIWPSDCKMRQGWQVGASSCNTRIVPRARVLPKASCFPSFRVLKFDIVLDLVEDECVRESLIFREQRCYQRSDLRLGYSH